MSQEMTTFLAETYTLVYIKNFNTLMCVCWYYYCIYRNNTHGLWMVYKITLQLETF